MDAQEALDYLISVAGRGYAHPSNVDEAEAALRRALAPPKVLASGNAMPKRKYRDGREWVKSPSGFDWYERRFTYQIHVHLDRAPKGSIPVLIVAAEEES